MFFAETLGPALTPATGAALYKYVQDKLAGRASVTVEELRSVVADYLARRGNSSTPEAAIQYLAKLGSITTESSGGYRMLH